MSESVERQGGPAIHPVDDVLQTVPVRLESDPAALSARVSDPERVAHALAQLSRSGVALTDFALGQPSLDEVFLALTGHPAEDDNEEDAA